MNEVPNGTSNRRARGDHYCKWEEDRQRWKARASVGYDARGKRVYLVRYGTSQSMALDRLRKALRERERGATRTSDRYTVEQAVRDWLEYYALTGRADATVESFSSAAENHLLPHLGKAKLKDLTARDVEMWLRAIAPGAGKSTLVKARMVLRRSVRRAIAHDLAYRNVADYVDLPEGGRPGRPSKSFTAQQADAVLQRTRGHRMHPYIVVSMLSGARTEEMRALRWDEVVLDPDPGIPPHMMVWRSTRKGGDTKTRKSRRTIALPQICVAALRQQSTTQEAEKAKAAGRWTNSGLVFTATLGAALDVNNVRRDFRTALRAVPGIAADDWTPRELRHSFVSLLSDAGVPLEAIARLVGHKGGSIVTELIYRHQIRPVVETGAEVMDSLFRNHSSDRSDPTPEQLP
ncbi:MAG: site-specific integrase [Nocardioides sp.]